MRRNSKQERERERAGDAKMFRAWKRWHAEQLEEALAGVHRDVLERVMAHLRNLKSARELVSAMAAEDWSTVDAETRLIVLHEVNVVIAALREKQGLPPIDDPLPDEPNNAFRIIKTLFQFPRPRKSRNPATAVTPGK